MCVALGSTAPAGVCVGRRGAGQFFPSSFLSSLVHVNGHSDDSSPSAGPTPILPAARPMVRSPEAESEPLGFDWSGLLSHSLRFLTVQHGFRILTEAGTRDGLKQVPRGYLNSLSNLHGWADGDEFYVNYVGHPMQGAVAGFIGTRTTGSIGMWNLAETADTGRAGCGRRR